MPIRQNGAVASVVIIGAGPGGYEAALVAAQLGAQVTIVDTGGPGGSAVLTDCVPSKTLIATADLLAVTAEAGSLGIRVDGDAPRGTLSVDLAAVNHRVKELATAQSRDIEARLAREGIDYVRGRGNNFGLIAVSTLPVAIQGEKSSSLSPRIRWRATGFE